MSKHTGRKATWTEISPTRYDSLYGFVQQNPEGKWDGFLNVLVRTPLGDKPVDRAWRTRRIHAGERRRSREAMMAVEAKRKEMQAKKNDDMRL